MDRISPVWISITTTAPDFRWRHSSPRCHEEACLRPRPDEVSALCHPRSRAGPSHSTCPLSDWPRRRTLVMCCWRPISSARRTSFPDTGSKSRKTLIRRPPRIDFDTLIAGLATELGFVRIFNAQSCRSRDRADHQAIYFPRLPPGDGRHVAGHMAGKCPLRIDPPQCPFKRHPRQIGRSNGQPGKFTLRQAFPDRMGLKDG